MIRILPDKRLPNHGVSALFVLLAFSLLSCSKEAPKAAAAATGGPAPAVVVHEISRQTVPIRSEFVARTDSVQTVEIRARVEAVLEESPFEAGKLVKKGQLLFKLDPATYEAALQSANAQLTKAEADLQFAKKQVNLKRAEAQLKQSQAALTKSEKDVERIRPLVKDEAVPAQELDAVEAQLQVAQSDVAAKEAGVENEKLNQEVSTEQAKAAVEAAKASVTQAKLNLSYTKLESPIDGLIGRKEVSDGNLVGRGEPTLLATVSVTDPINVLFSISENDYLRFVRERQAGAKSAGELDLVLADGTVYPQKGTFSVLERALDPTTGTLAVEATFPNPDNLLRPGQFARVRAAVEEVPDAILIPQRAVMEMQGASIAMVVGADNTVSVRTLSLGERYENYYVVRSGLEAGERVIVEGIQKARPGQKVEPTAQPATQEAK